MEGLELVCFQIISNVGMARSNYIEAIQSAKAGEFDAAKKLVEEGEKYYLQGSEAHLTLIQQEASGTPVSPTLLLLHAEDQMMSADAFKIIANELIDNYKRIVALEAR